MGRAHQERRTEGQSLSPLRASLLNLQEPPSHPDNKGQTETWAQSKRKQLQLFPWNLSCHEKKPNQHKQALCYKRKHFNTVAQNDGVLRQLCGEGFQIRVSLTAWNHFSLNRIHCVNKIEKFVVFFYFFFKMSGGIFFCDKWDLISELSLPACTPWSCAGCLQRWLQDPPRKGQMSPGLLSKSHKS